MALAPTLCLLLLHIFTLRVCYIMFIYMWDSVRHLKHVESFQMHLCDISSLGELNDYRRGDALCFCQQMEKVGGVCFLNVSLLGFRVSLRRLVSQISVQEVLSIHRMSQDSVKSILNLSGLQSAVWTDPKSGCYTPDLREEGWRSFACVRAPPAGQDGDLVACKTQSFKTDTDKNCSLRPRLFF